MTEPPPQTTATMSHRQNQNNGSGPVVTPRNEAVLHEILRRRLCFLSGGRDRQGGAILTIPTTSAALDRLKADELLETFRYLTQIPSEDVQRHEFTIIIDMRSSTWNNTKTLLRSIQETFPGSIRAVYVVKPDDFNHRPKAGPGGQPKYGFEMSLISADQLPKHININQLTEDLGGTLYYKHEEWLHLRKTIELFTTQAMELLDVLEAHRKGLLSPELASTFDAAEVMVKQHHELKKQLAKYPVEPMEDEGTKILLRFDPKFGGQQDQGLYFNGTNGQNGVRSAQNPDIQTALIRVKQLVDRLHGCRVQLDQAWALRLERLQYSRQLRSFEHQAEQILACLGENCQQLLKSCSDIGTSLSRTLELEKQHEQFQMGCMDLFQHIARALDFGTKLLSSGNYGSQLVKQLVDRLNHERDSFSLCLKERTAVLSLSSLFHRKAEEFTSNSSVWHAASDPEEGQAQNNAEIEAMIVQHKFVEKSVEQAYAEVSTSGSHLHDKQRRPLHHSVTMSFSLSATDFTRACTHVSSVRAKVHTEYCHLKQRLETKKRKLEQQYALRLFSDDVRQVIDWIEKWGNPFLEKTCEVGKNLARARKLKESHHEFESRAKNTYANAAKLMEAAERLIENGACNVEEVQVSSSDLGKHSQEFKAKVATRKVLLDTACTFYERLSNLTALLERARRSLSTEPNTDTFELTVEGLNRMHQERQAVVESCTHTEHEGHSLLRQMSNCLMTHTPDYEHVENMLRIISDSRMDLEEAWEPRKLKLEVLYKLRVFERSAEEIIQNFEDWSALVEKRHAENPDREKSKDEILTYQVASQELESLGQRSSYYNAHIQEAFNRGGELLQFLEKSSKIAELIDVPAMCAQVTDINEELTIRHESLAEVVEMYRMHLQHIIRLHECEVRGQQVLQYIQACYRKLQSLDLALVSAARCAEILKRCMPIEKDIRMVHATVEEFQQCAEEIEHSDIDRADQARHFKEKIVVQWQSLQAYSTEVVKTIRSGQLFFEYAEQVLTMLDSLRQEYDGEQDWCILKKFNGVDSALDCVMELMERHRLQKQNFMKICNTVRKYSETFLKGMGRLVSRASNGETSHFQAETAVKNTVRAVLEAIRQQESSVMQKWTTRNPSFDQCRNYLKVEKSACQALAWIQDAGERYLSSREPVAKSHMSAEILLAEHRVFVERAEENREKIKLLISLADSVVRNGQDCHVDRIMKCVAQVEIRQKDFMDRMKVYKQHLGERVVSSGSGKQRDRNSDSSLEGKLSEFAVNGAPKTEEEKKLIQRKHIMKELLDTEQTYVNDLGECITYFVRNEKNSRVSAPPDLVPRLPVIFGNVEQIYDFHSKVFLKELQKYEQVPEDVAHCFLAWAGEFDMYVEYCENKPAATDRMVEPVAIEYFEKLKESYGLPANNTIASYLIKPVQRITKYSLLLKELVKTCADERKEIQEALDMMRDVPRKANDAINLSRLEGYPEPLEHLGELLATDFFQVSEPTRVLTKQHPRQVFLFELAILFAKRIGEGLKDPKFVFKFKLPTAGLVLTKNADKDPDLSFVIGWGRSPQFHQSSPESKYVFRAMSKDIKEAWIAKLEDVKSLANSSVVDTISLRTKSSRTAPDSSRTSRDFEDGQSLEDEGGSSHERYSIISQSSSNTTDSDKVLHEGEWATVTDNYEAIHDGELTVQKGDCVEIVDRMSSSKQDLYLVRIKSGNGGPTPRHLQSHRASLVPSSQSGSSLAVASSSFASSGTGKVLEGYLPGTILSVMPTHRSAGLPSPSANPMDTNQTPTADGFSGSASTMTLPVPQSATGDDGSLGDSTLSTTSAPPPTTKRRNTFRKIFNNPLRKLSSNRIDTGSIAKSSSGGGVPIAPVPKKGSVVLLGSNSASASYSPPSSAGGSSRAKTSFQSAAAVAPVAGMSDDALRRSSAPPLAQAEGDDEHYMNIGSSISAPVSANVSLDVVAAAAREPISIIQQPSDENVGVASSVSTAEMPPAMELTQLKMHTAISGLNPPSNTLLPMSTMFSLASALPAVAHATAETVVSSSTSSQLPDVLPDSLSHSHSLLLSSSLPASEGAILTSHTTDLVSIQPKTTELAAESEIENLLAVDAKMTDKNDPLSPISRVNIMSRASDEPSLSKIMTNGSSSFREIGGSMDTGDPALSATKEGNQTGELANRLDADGEQKNGPDDTPEAAPEPAPEPETAIAVQDPTAKAVIMRDYVLRELVDTERDYVKDLGLIIDGYIAHMHNNPVPDDMNGRDKLIFGNIEQIYVFHRDTFYGELEKCLDAADRLPQAFIRYERKFQMYVVYCQNKPKSEFVVSEYVDSYFEEIRLKLGEKLKLPDMLIKPVQRVMRYQLMLKDIMKYTERAGLGEKSVADLQKAMNCIMGICKLANDFMEVGRLQGFEGKLTAQGKLLLQDSFLVCETFTAVAPPGQTPKDKEKEKKKEEDASGTNNKFKERQIFVFEQVVIFSESLGSGSHKNKSTYSSPVYIYKSHIQVNKMSLIEVEKDVVRFALRSRDPNTGDRMFVIEAPSQDKRDLWVAQIKTMLDTQQNFLRALQSPIDFQRQQGRQQGEEMTLTPAIVSTALLTTSAPPLVSELLSSTLPPHASHAGRPPHKAPTAETSKLKATMRPKSLVEPDRRRPLSIPRSPESPNSIVRGYTGSVTGPITPPPIESVIVTPLVSSTPTVPGITRKSSGRFLFPVPALKVVHSEADLLKKGAKSGQNTVLETSSGMTASSSKSSLAATEPAESKSRRWSISGRRDKSPSAPGTSTPSTPVAKGISSLSFRKKN